jgi:hypothetical protein
MIKNGKIMVQIFMLVLCLLSFVGPVFGSEMAMTNEWAIEEVQVFLGLRTDYLVYSSFKNRDACQVFGIDIIENEPCSPLSFRYQRLGSANARKIYDQFVSKIEAIPLRYVAVNNELKNGYEIVSYMMSMNNSQYHVKMFVLENLCSRYDVDFLLYKFGTNPCFFSKDEKELIERELITVEGYHGPKGYFSEDKFLLYVSELKKKYSS